MKHRIFCSGTQIECFNHWNNLFNFYCFGRIADKTGELAYMATHFDSFFANHTGHGIAFPVANRTDAPPPNKWYIFE